jgi:hypothetical protein
MVLSGDPPDQRPIRPRLRADRPILSLPQECTPDPLVRSRYQFPVLLVHATRRHEHLGQRLGGQWFRGFPQDREERSGQFPVHGPLEIRLGVGGTVCWIILKDDSVQMGYIV